MFYHLFGTLEIVEPGMLVIDCGGVGYKMTTSLITSNLLADRIGKEVKVFCELVVREDGIELFGFENKEERECFKNLVTVSGVGPKAATNILSIMTPDSFAIAVCTEDAKAISKANGIGGKTAARIILELKDKMSVDLGASTPKKVVGKQAVLIPKGNLTEAQEGLMVLGYDKSTAAEALAGLDPNMDTGELLRLALKRLAK